MIYTDQINMIYVSIKWLVALCIDATSKNNNKRYQATLIIRYNLGLLENLSMDLFHK